MEEALRDCFVCGLNNEATQKRLLIENDLTILKAIEIGTNLESAERNTRVMKSSKPGVSVEANVKAINPQPCYRCGRKDHAPAHCKFKDAVCYSCGKRGHISPACRGKKRDDTLKQLLSKQEVGEILQSGLVRQLKTIQILLMISHYLPFVVNLHPQSLLT